MQNEYDAYCSRCKRDRCFNEEGRCSVCGNDSSGSMEKEVFEERCRKYLELIKWLTTMTDCSWNAVNKIRDYVENNLYDADAAMEALGEIAENLT